MELYQLIKKLLPQDNCFPTYADAERALDAKGREASIRIDVCINDCILYRNRDVRVDRELKFQYETLRACPKCGHPRFKKKLDGTDSKTPFKVFDYIPIDRSAKALFTHPQLASVLRLSTEPQRQDGIMDDIQDSPGWKDTVLEDERLNRDPLRRCLVLSICQDGVTPWKKENNLFNFIPLMLMVLNLPEKLRKMPRYMIIPGFIACSRVVTEGGLVFRQAKIHAYIQFIIDEINTLYYIGVKAVDGVLPVTAPNRTFRLRVKLILSSADYPGHSSMNCQQGATAISGCHKCVIRSENCPILHKQIFDKGIYDPKTNDEVRRYAAEVRDLDGIYSNAALTRLKQHYGVTGYSPLLNLPNFNIITDCPIDVMHTFANVVKDLISLLKGTCTIKVSGNATVQQQEIIDELVSFRVSTELRTDSDRKYLHVMDSAPGWVGERTTLLFKRGHTCKTSYYFHLIEYFGKYVLTGMFEPTHEKIVCDLLDVMQLCVQRRLISASLDQLEVNLNAVIDRIYENFPRFIHKAMLHLLRHIVPVLRRWGPAK